MPAREGYPLLEALAQVKDYRKLRGQRHALKAVLALAFCAAVCGCSSLTAISQWGRGQNPEVLKPLGFKHRPPCVATLHRLFRRLDVASLEQALTTWWQSWFEGRGGLALDGKTVRGSRCVGQDALQVLAAFAQDVGAVIAQAEITGNDEIGTALRVLQGLDLRGWILTGDAKLTQLKLCKTMVEGGGDYVLTVKENQPSLYRDIELLFSEVDVVADTLTTMHEAGLHGQRIELRSLQASSALAGYCEWPGLQQVFRIERTFIDKHSHKRLHKVHFGITSLPPQRADASRIAALLRGHWAIENKLHWVRDVVFAEDASRVRSGHAPHVMTIFRNLAISMIWLCGFSSLIAGLRHFAWHPALAIHFACQKPSLALAQRMK